MTEPNINIRLMSSVVQISTEMAMMHGLIPPSAEYLAAEAERAKTPSPWCDSMWSFDEVSFFCELSNGHQGKHQAQSAGDEELTATITWETA